MMSFLGSEELVKNFLPHNCTKVIIAEPIGLVSGILARRRLHFNAASHFMIQYQGSVGSRTVYLPEKYICRVPCVADISQLLDRTLWAVDDSLFPWAKFFAPLATPATSPGAAPSFLISQSRTSHYV
jgi:hypothetical protein